MPWPVGPTTLAGVIVPVMVAGGAGHACVPAGALVIGGLFAHSHTLMPPGAPFSWPKWMCACVTAPSSAAYDRRYWILSWNRLISALNLPLPVVDSGSGVSSKPLSRSL